MKTIRLKRHANIIPDDIFTYLGCGVITNYQIPKIELEKLHHFKCKEQIVLNDRKLIPGNVLTLTKEEVVKTMDCNLVKKHFSYIGCTNAEEHIESQIGFVKSIRICNYKYNKDYKYMIYITIRIDDEKYSNIVRGLLEKYITDFMFYLSSNKEKYLSLVSDADENYLLASA